MIHSSIFKSIHQPNEPTQNDTDEVHSNQSLNNQYNRFDTQQSNTLFQQSVDEILQNIDRYASLKISASNNLLHQQTWYNLTDFTSFISTHVIPLSDQSMNAQESVELANQLAQTAFNSTTSKSPHNKIESNSMLSENTIKTFLSDFFNLDSFSEHHTIQPTSGLFDVKTFSKRIIEVASPVETQPLLDTKSNQSMPIKHDIILPQVGNINLRVTIHHQNDIAKANEIFQVISDLATHSESFRTSLFNSTRQSGGILELEINRTADTTTIASARLSNPPLITLNLNLSDAYKTPANIAHILTHELVHLDPNRSGAHHGPEFSADMVKIMLEYLNGTGQSAHDIEGFDYSSNSLGDIEDILNETTVQGYSLGDWFNELSYSISQGNFSDANDLMRALQVTGLQITWSDQFGEHEMPVADWMAGVLVYETFDSLIGKTDNNLFGDHDPNLATHLSNFYQYLQVNNPEMASIFDQQANRYGLEFPLNSAQIPDDPDLPNDPDLPDDPDTPPTTGQPDEVYVYGKLGEFMSPSESDALVSNLGIVFDLPTIASLMQFFEQIGFEPRQTVSVLQTLGNIFKKYESLFNRS